MTLTSAARRRSLAELHEASYYRWFGADGALSRVIQPGDRILDVGCSDGRGSRVLSDRGAAGVDVHRPTLTAAKDGGRRSPVAQADIRQLPFRSRSFDVVASLDVIEHFDKADARAVIIELERVAKRAVVLMTPRGFVPQPPTDDEPWQQHRCGFAAEELRALGYRVEGQGGYAAWRGAYGAFRGGLLGQLAAVGSAPLIRRAPHLAFHLIGMKEVGHGYRP